MRDDSFQSLEPRTLFSAPFPLAQTFGLHSLEGALHTIYLDFTGHTTAGTSWNTYYNIPTIVSQPYDIDDTPAFSDEELTRIQHIWQRVMEDFSPFAVNVTTEEPPLGALIKTNSSDSAYGIRVVICPDDFDSSNSRGGVAYVNSFNWNSDTPCFVFSDKRAAGNEKSVAECVSHEVGHTLGLRHDGQGDTVYYRGHGSGATGWGPIMGNANREVTQWSKGEYSGATNTEDDLAIIVGNNGFGYRADDASNTLIGAASLTHSGGAWRASGIIERNTDVDVYTFTVGTTDWYEFSILPYERGPNLDIEARLMDAAGNTLTLVNHPDLLDAGFVTQLQSGTYYLSITGAADPKGNYSAYGSLGQYSVSVSSSHVAPEIVVTGAGTNIVDGDKTPSAADGTHFGELFLNGDAVIRTFTVTNTGTAPLIITGLSLPQGFVLLDGLTSPIMPGQSDDVKIQLTPSTTGVFKGTVTILSNDGDENPFTFVIAAEVLTQTPTPRPDSSDFNWDGHDDIVYCDSRTGAVRVQLLKRGIPTGETLLLRRLPNTAWRVIGGGDFNGDGNADLLLRDDMGGVRIWHFRQTTYRSQRVLPRVTAGFTVAGVADFDKDGFPDIVWRNEDNGKHIIWSIAGGVKNLTGSMPQLASFRTAGVADFTGDGMPDLLLRDPGTGRNHVWRMNGTNFSASIRLRDAAAAWKVGDTRDYDADGVADILWRDAQGRQLVWFMNRNGTTKNVRVVAGYRQAYWYLAQMRESCVAAAPSPSEDAVDALDEAMPLPGPLLWKS